MEFLWSFPNFDIGIIHWPRVMLPDIFSRLKKTPIPSKTGKGYALIKIRRITFERLSLYLNPSPSFNFFGREDPEVCAFFYSIMNISRNKKYMSWFLFTICTWFCFVILLFHEFSKKATYKNNVPMVKKKIMYIVWKCTFWDFV